MTEFDALTLARFVAGGATHSNFGLAPLFWDVAARW